MADAEQVTAKEGTDSVEFLETSPASELVKAQMWRRKSFGGRCRGWSRLHQYTDVAHSSFGHKKLMMKTSSPISKIYFVDV